MTTETLRDDVTKMSTKYSDDVDDEELYTEISRLKQIHKANISPSDDAVKPFDLLNKITKLKLTSLFPNICVALRIFLTMPVTVASGERSFSKLAYIKNKLRNSSTQDRLVALSMLSIECELAREVNFDTVIDVFAQTKARKAVIAVK